jgi:hypothetical protein
MARIEVEIRVTEPALAVPPTTLSEETETRRAVPRTIAPLLEVSTEVETKLTVLDLVTTALITKALELERLLPETAVLIAVTVSVLVLSRVARAVGPVMIAAADSTEEEINATDGSRVTTALTESVAVATSETVPNFVTPAATLSKDCDVIAAPPSCTRVAVVTKLELLAKITDPKSSLKAVTDNVLVDTSAAPATGTVVAVTMSELEELSVTVATRVTTPVILKVELLARTTELTLAMTATALMVRVLTPVKVAETTCAMVPVALSELLETIATVGN